MEVLYFFAEIRNPFLDGLFQFFTYFGEELLIVGIICVLYWCLNKQLAYQLGVTFFVSGLLAQNLKITFRIPRPWVLDPAFEAVPSAVPSATGYSFPSGHTQSATALFGTFFFHCKKRIVKIFCVSAFLLVGVSRMYLGVHTPKDVITSMVITLLTAWLVTRMFGKFQNTKKENTKISIFLTVASIATILYALTLLHLGTITTHFAADCCKAGGAGLGFALGWYVEHTYINFSTKLPAIKQVVKFVIGITIALLLKVLFKQILGSGIFAETAQYFILVLWIIAIYPFCFTKIKFFS